MKHNTRRNSGACVLNQQPAGKADGRAEEHRESAAVLSPEIGALRPAVITEVRDDHSDENDEGCDDEEAFHEPDEQTYDEPYAGHCRFSSARREECPEHGCPGDHPRAVVGDRCGGMHLAPG